MRRISVLSIIYISKSYLFIRRSLSKVPFIYALYCRSNLLRTTEKSFSSLLGALGGSFRKGKNIRLSKEDQQRLQYLLSEKRYRDFLYLANNMAAGGCLFGGNMVMELLYASALLKSWRLFDKALLPELKIIAFDAIRETSLIIKNDCQLFLEEVALILIQNSRISDALKVLYLIELIDSKPRYDTLINLLNFIQSEDAEIVRRSETITIQCSEEEINLVGSIVWGKKYLDDFMNYNVRSMLASGNMPALKAHGLLVHSIVTTPEGKEFIENHAVYAELSKVAQVEFFCFPEKCLGLFTGEDGPDKWSYMLYGILDHINILFARSLKANLFLIPVDSIVANPSFTNMHRYLKEGYDCCGAGNLVAERDSFLKALKDTYGVTGALEIKTKDLASLALKHPHNYITSQLVHDQNKSFGKHAREIFWPVPEGIVVHSIYTHPLATSARRICSDYVMPFSWVDFLLPVRMFSDADEFPKYKIIENAEEAYINNFAPASRVFEVTGRAFSPNDFVAAHTYSHPIHHSMLNTRQFIPCEYEPLKCSNDVDSDIIAVKKELEKHFVDKLQNTKYNASGCRLCSSTDLHEVINLGYMPLSHQLRKSLSEKEYFFPVHFHYCNNCGLLQIHDTIQPDILYDAETYSTSFQKPRHIDELITTVVAYKSPGAVLDVGCNDGSLLKSLKGHGFNILVGIEPNSHAAVIAKEGFQNIYVDYLTSSSSESLLKKHAKFDFIFARHVLEHVTDLEDFFASLNMLLLPDGLFIMELPHVETGFAFGNPVILWEEHVNYFTEDLVHAMFRRYGFEVLDKRYYAFGGGSVAFIARRILPETLNLAKAKSFSLSYYQGYADRIHILKEDINSLLTLAKSRNYEVAIYGAAPRSCTMINYIKCGANIDFVIDDRADIHNRYMPGTDKPIHSLSETNLGSKKPLVLLGVGAENEYKVLEKLKAKLGYYPVSVSLFPPRDVYTSVKDAINMLNNEVEEKSRVA